MVHSRCRQPRITPWEESLNKGPLDQAGLWACLSGIMLTIFTNWREKTHLLQVAPEWGSWAAQVLKVNWTQTCMHLNRVQDFTSQLKPLLLWLTHNLELWEKYFLPPKLLLWEYDITATGNKTTTVWQELISRIFKKVKIKHKKSFTNGHMAWTDSLTRSKSGLHIDEQAVRELQNKVTLRFYLTLVRMAIIGEK